MELDDNVCLCFRVSRRKLEKFIRLHQPQVASQLAECGGAGTGCGWCVPFLKQLFRKAASDASNELETLSAEEYQSQRRGYIQEGKGKPPAGSEPT